MNTKISSLLCLQVALLLSVLVCGSAFAWASVVQAQETVAETVVTETETATIIDESTEGAIEGAFIFNEVPEDPAEEVVAEELPAETESAPESVPEPTVADDPVVAPAAVVQAEKDDYHPGETATIFGRFFSPLTTFMIKVFGSDENSENYTETEEEVSTDEQGGFSFSYLLDALYRPFYEVIVSTLEGEQVAWNWFRDSSVGTYDQCSNDDGDGYASGDTGCRWTQGNIQANNSAYYEGDATVQRLWLEGFAPNTSHTVTFKYGTTKGGDHAYDYLTTWDESENWVSIADRCQDVDGCVAATEMQFPMQNDPNLTDAIEPSPASRFFTMRGGAITNVSVPAIVSGTYAADSETAVTVTFTTGSKGTPMCETTLSGTGQNKIEVTSCGVALWFGAHVAESSLWFAENGTSGAGDIPGSPYHVALEAVDGTSVGQRDNQMQSAAIIPPAATGVITIIKNTVPDDAQDFAFTTTGTGLSNFSLDDDGTATPLSNTQTFSELADGTYSVTELASAGFDLTNLQCTDLTGGTVINGATANIDLSGGETITCTYTNTKRGAIKIVKNTIGGNGTFDFTGNTGVTQLTTVNGTAQQTISNVVPGAYTIAETVPSGWSLTSATCDSGEAIDSLDVEPGETVTCTFTNAKDATLTLVKNVTNDNGGTADADDFQGKIDGNNVPWGVAQTVSAGAHTASETNLPTYTASAWGGDCAADGSVTLAAGENKTCTITNDDKAPVLHLRKVVVNNNGGGATVGDFTLTANGAAANDISGTSPVDSGSGLLADTFALSETTMPGYTASDWVCVGGTQNGANITLGLGEEATCTITNDDQQAYIVVDKTVVNDNGGTAAANDFLLTVGGNAVQDGVAYAVNPGTHKAGETLLAGYAASDWGTDCDADGDVTVALGETKTCTITNNDVAPKLTLNKIIVNDNGGTAAEADWTLTATGPTNVSGPGATGDTDVVSDATFATGVYTLSESTGPAGYTASGWTCSNGDNDGTISVALGADITCSITNDDNAPSLTLVKKVINDNGGTAVEADFTLTANGPTGFNGVGPSVSNGASFDAGQYSLSESGPSGYTASDWVCVGGTQNGASVTLGLGTSATCTITNDDIAPKLHLRKVIVNDDGGSADVTDWTLTANGTDTNDLSGVTPVDSGASLIADTFALSETGGPSGYTASDWVCVGGTQNGASITLGINEEATCTITNDDQTGKLIVHKVTDPSTDTTTQFSITASADSGTVEGVAAQTIAGGETETYTVHAGVYDVTESALAGWDMTGNTCVNVAVANGEEKHCTITNTKKGHLIVEKTTLPGGDATSFAITASGSGTITGGGAGSVTDAANHDYEVTPGTYSVTETVPAGWDMTENTCDDVVVAAGETKNCSITNVKRGSITIVKDAISNSAQDFTFNNNFGNGHPATFKLDDDSNAILLNTRTFEVLPGTYAVSEDAVAGWQQEGATCTDQSPVGAIEVAPGENVTCTFVNEEYAKIVLIKNTVGGNGDFDFDGTGAGLPADIDLSTVAETATVTFNDLDQDNTYSIAENVPEGWVLLSSSCTGSGNTPASITPDPGETVTCTFTNGKLPTLTLTKTVENNYGGTAEAADFQGKINDVNQAWSVAKTLTPGTYTATETGLFGYTASAWGTDCSAEGSVTLAYGEIKTCSITNSDIAPKLTVIKHVINDNGGDDVAENFTMNVTGTQVSVDSFAGSETGVTVTLDAGNYSADESAYPGYTKTLSKDCSGVIGIGEEKTCTITNDDQPAKITLTKVVTNNNGGAAQPNDFGLTIGGNAAVSGQAYEVNSNTEHALNEAGLTGYAFVSLTGDATCPAVLGGTVKLGEGEEVSCTITNDDIPAHLIVIKHVDNGNTGGTAAASDFTTTISGVTTATPVAAGAEAPGVDNVLTSVGAYSVDEGAHVGYEKQLSAECSGTIALGQTKTCTITNTAIAPKLTVIKIVDNGNTGATFGPSDFQMKVDGDDVPQNVAQTETVGVHDVTETGPAGYSATYSGDCNEDGEVTLALADSKTCTITNTAIAPKLTLVKTVINNNGGTKQIADFPLSIDATGVTSGVANTVTVGNHTASEVANAGYTASAWGGDCAADGSVTLSLAENKTCTITNDDKPGKLEIIKTTVGGNDTFGFTVAGPTPSTPSVTTVGNTGTTGVFEVNAGSYSATEAAKAGWDLTSSSCSVGTPASFAIANGETVTCTFVNTKRATVTIVKDAQPQDTQDFAFTSSVLGNFTLDDDANVPEPAAGEELNEWSNSKTIANVIPGVVKVMETQPSQYWKLKTASCVETGTQNVVTATLVGTELTFTAGPGANVTCTFVNEKLSPTRTQGFWQTHTAYTSNVFTSLVTAMKIGTNPTKIDTLGELFGAWYSSIPKKTDGKQRTALDKARMTLLQQLVTAKLNCAKFGCSSDVQTMIATADTAYQTGTAAQIIASAGLLDAYNNSGDTIIVGNTGKATPKNSQNLADKPFWNVLP